MARALAALSPADTAAIDRDFRKRAQSVLAIDVMIGQLQAAVAAIGATDNTYFVFSSDNGYHMGEHRLLPGKMTAFDTDIHVPLVVTGPGVVQGRTLDELVENIDLCPTFAELAGVAIATTADGHTLVPLLRGEPIQGWRDLALVEHHGPLDHEADDPDAPGIRSGNPPSYGAIRAREWVYVEYEDGTREYHDRTSDPYELQNTFWSLTPVTRQSLHVALTALQACQGAQACWESAGFPPASPAK